MGRYECASHLQPPNHPTHSTGARLGHYHGRNIDRKIIFTGGCALAMAGSNNPKHGGSRRGVGLVGRADMWGIDYRKLDLSNALMLGVIKSKQALHLVAKVYD